MFWLSDDDDPSVPTPTVTPRGDGAAHVGDAVAQPQVRSGIVRQRAAVPREQVHLRIVDPNGVGAAEPRPEQADLVEMRRQRGAVALLCAGALHGGFRQMRLQRHAEFRRHVTTGEHERVRAMQRDGRRDAEADAVARVRPGGGCVAYGRQDRIGRCGAHRVGNRTQLRRKRIEQTGDRLIEAAIGDHRCDHRAHADIGIGLRHDVQPFDRRHRQHRRKIVTAGAALAQHLHRGQQRRKIAVIVRAVAVDPGARVQQQLQRPEIADALPQSAVTMRVRIDQAGDDQASGGVDPLRRIGGARSNDRSDTVAVQNDIRRPRTGLARGQHGATNNDNRIVLAWSSPRPVRQATAKP